MATQPDECSRSIHLCHEEVSEDELADVAAEAIEGVGDANDILSKVAEVRAASDAHSEHDPQPPDLTFGPVLSIYRHFITYLLQFRF